MTTLKETLEVGESSVSQGASHPKSESGHLRSDAVSLDVPVRVHGSRVTEIVRGITPHTEPFEEQTTTMIVFPQGGVLRMSTVVSVGQAVVLTNLKSRQDAICRVVKVRTNPNLHSYIEIEFTHAQPGYWGVHFASDAPAPAKRSAPVAPPVASIPAAPVAPAVAPKPEVAAKEKTVFEGPAASVPGLSLAELRGDAPAVSGKSSPGAKVAEEAEEAEELEVGSQAIEESPAGKESATFGRSAASSSLGAPRAASREFGSRLEYGTLGAASQAAETGQGEGRNWFLMAACAAVLFAAVGGGAFYFYSRSATRLAISAPAAPELPARADAVENPASVPPAASESASRHASAPSPAPPVAVHTTDAVPARPGKPAGSEDKPTPSTKQKASSAASAVPDMFGALNAHPVSSGRATDGSREAAPSIDPGMATGNETSGLPAVAVPPVNLAPPTQPAAAGPVSVGGEVRPPKVVSPVSPVYPAIARQANVQGNVVVRVTIDKAGNVSDARAISGPALLREAAVDALRRQKYQPSTLNGQPISIEMLVTVQFRF
jgi:periplasmic protein TonB